MLLAQNPAPLPQRVANATRLSDIQAHWAVDFIAALVERDIMRGFPDGTFRPDARVNRAEFAAVIERAFASRLSQTGRRTVPEFSDLPANHWAYGAVKTAYALGFLGSYADNTFRPDQQITRVQVIVSLVKGLNLQASNSTPQTLAAAFDDAGTIPDYARESIIAALENRLLFSDPNIRQLYPNQIATRADLAALVYRSLAISGLLPDRPAVARVPSPPPPPPTATASPRPAMTEPRVAFTGNFTSVEDVFDGYTLGGGDRVRIDYLSAPEYNNETLVLGDGTLNLPLIGKIAVRGMTPEQAASAITAKYGYYIREPLVTLTLVQPRPVRVAISGEINRPGSYSVSLRESGQFPSVSQIIEQAGGITQTANLREVLVRRPRESGAPQIISLNLMSIVSGAAINQDLPLRDGDSIFIPTSAYADPEEATQIATSSLAGATPQSLTIAVIGEVVRPGTHTVTTENGGANPGAKAFPTITKALQIAGGITQSADLRRVEIRRPTRSGSITVIPIDLAQLLAAGDLRQDAILQQGDTIVIPTNPNPSQADTALIASASFAAATPQSLKIAVVGEVARPGTHTVTPEGTGADGVISFPTVTQALQVAGGITQAADLRGVFIRRPNRSGGEQLIAVDLWQLLQGGDLRQDAILQQGDTIVIPTNPNPNPAASALIASASFAADAATPLNIAVVGEVIRPGTYTVAGQTGAGSEEGTGGFPTVTKALQVAGGITPSADIRSIQVRRFTKNGSEQMIAVNLWELLQSGDLRQDIILQQGDTIVIPTADTLTAAEATELAAVTFSPNQIRVNVVGEVFKPGEVQVPPNSPLTQALLAAGGFTNRSSKGEVELIRLNPNGTVSRRQIEVDFSGGINEATNPILLNNDAIVVDRSGFTKFTDSVGKVTQPVGGLLGIFNIFRILGF